MENVACPGCGCEPEITHRLEENGEVVGYRCACNAVVVGGVMTGATQ